MVGIYVNSNDVVSILVNPSIVVVSFEKADRVLCQYEKNGVVFFKPCDKLHPYTTYSADRMFSLKDIASVWNSTVYSSIRCILHLLQQIVN